MRNLLIIFIAIIVSSCAYTTAKRIDYTSTEEGIRFYDPLPLLIINCQNTQVVNVADFSRGYALKYGAFLAKNNTDIKMTEGLLTETSSDLDDTALLSMLQALGQSALGAVKDLASLNTLISGPLPGMEGIWRLDYGIDGKLAGIKRIFKAPACPPTPATPAPAIQAPPIIVKPPK